MCLHTPTCLQVFSAKPYLALVMEFVPNGDMFQVGMRGAKSECGCEGTGAEAAAPY